MSKIDLSTKTWIDVYSEVELAYWSKRFHVTNAELLQAIAAVGKTVKYVDSYLERKMLAK